MWWWRVIFDVNERWYDNGVRNDDESNCKKQERKTKVKNDCARCESSVWARTL